MVKSDKKNSQVSDLVDRCDEEILFSSPSYLFILLSTSTFNSPKAIPSSNLITKSKNTNIKYLTKIMPSLVLFFYSIQSHINQTQVGTA